MTDLNVFKIIGCQLKMILVQDARRHQQTMLIWQMSCHEILIEKRGMYCVAVKFVPRFMSQDQKDNRITICQELLDRAHDDQMVYGLWLLIREKFNHHNGSVNFHQDRKKLVMSDQTLKSWQWYFSILQVLSTSNFCRKDKQSTYGTI